MVVVTSLNAIVVVAVVTFVPVAIRFVVDLVENSKIGPNDWCCWSSAYVFRTQSHRDKWIPGQRSLQGSVA